MLNNTAVYTYDNLDKIIHRTEYRDWVAAVITWKNNPIMSMLCGHGDRNKRNKRYSQLLVLNYNATNDQHAIMSDKPYNGGMKRGY